MVCSHRTAATVDGGRVRTRKQQLNHLSRRAILALLLAGVPSLQASPTDTGAATSSAARVSAGPWWKHALIYEIYPRSFQDSNGDGIGDLNGITQRLPYLRQLGVDAVWLTPMYPSPQVDFGYDISNYKDVDPQYGTMADFDRMLAEAKRDGIRLCLDFVVNHTSDKHAWFVESASSRTSPKRDWYIWRDPKGYTADGKPVPPNNWQSLFGHSAWQWDPHTKQFYYHQFYAQQPDLNWRNPAVEKAMFDVVRFWLDKGVAGFRLDAVPTMFENPALPDAKLLPGTNNYGDPNQDTGEYNNLPEVHDVMRRLRALVDTYPGDRVLIGETYLDSPADLNRWYGGAKHDELQLPMDTQVGLQKTLDAATLRRRIDEAETELDGNQPLFVFDNHDQARSWNRYGDGVHDAEIARAIATVLLTTKATALMYYGEELGMVTSTPARVQDVQDPIGRMGWPKEKGRDGERTPMQWSPGPQAGFSTNPHTWLPVASDYKTVNVETEMGERASLLRWHRQLIAMRRNNPALRDGSLTMLDTANASVLSYVRKSSGGASVVVAVNCTATPQTVSLQASLRAAGTGGLPHAPARVKTLLTDAPPLRLQSSLNKITLPAYGTWVGSVE